MNQKNRKILLSSAVTVAMLASGTASAAALEENPVNNPTGQLTDTEITTDGDSSNTAVDSETNDTLNTADGETSLLEDEAVQLSDDSTSSEGEESNIQPVSSKAKSTEVEESEVNLYFIDDAYADKITLPSGYESTHQIIIPEGTEGTPAYAVQGSSVTVDDSGLIKPNVKIWYNAGSSGGFTQWTTSYIEGAQTRTEYVSGQSTVTVTCGDYKQTITVNVSSYEGEYAQSRLNEIYDEVTADASLQGAELAEAFTKYVANNFDYDYRYSGAEGMLVSGGGDCWASTALINELCKKAGFECDVRYAANYPGAASGHRNSIIKINGKYYVADSGYSGSAPRAYDFHEEAEGLYMQGTTVVQYDAFEKEAVIPETVAGNTITAIRNTANGSVFGYGVDVTSVNLPKTVEDISDLAFQGCTSLQNITVDEDNPNFMSVDGILYSKSGQLIRVPDAKTEVVLDKNMKSIGGYALSGSKVKEVSIPDGVTSIGFAAFWNSYATVITVPESVTEIDEHAFETRSDVTIKGVAGSFAEQYAKDNGLTFEEIKSAPTDPDDNNSGDNSGDTGDSGNTGGDEGNTGDSGNTGGDEGNTGDSGNTGGDEGNTGDSGNTGGDEGNTEDSGNTGGENNDSDNESSKPGSDNENQTPGNSGIIITESTEPSESVDNGDKKIVYTVSTVETGDDTHIMSYITSGFIALCAGITVLFKKKKKSQE